ncbi:MAG: homocysteine S-methyltransferase family protein [bacterium]|nr:homocysteine S-methyltransferase family protein [bacterium]
MPRSIRPLFDERLYVTNAGTETYLVFQQGFDLPEFCGFVVYEDEPATQRLAREHLEPIFESAARSGCGLLLDILSWRAQPDFLALLGRPAEDLGRLNAQLVESTRSIVQAWRKRSGVSEDDMPILLCADVGPRGDGYRIEGDEVSPEQAQAYHTPQITALAAAGVDLMSALTMTSGAESIGMTRAAAEAGLPIIVSPTVETDGRLPDGWSLGDFIERVDRETDSAPLFYMVNCAHPSHLRPTLDAAQDAGAPWLERFKGFRANASSKSHAELDESTTLDRGEPEALARELAEMKRRFDLRVVGGCCGTDHEHMDLVARMTPAD